MMTLVLRALPLASLADAVAVRALDLALLDEQAVEVGGVGAFRFEEDAAALVGFPQVAIDVMDKQAAQIDALHLADAVGENPHAGAPRRGLGPRLVISRSAISTNEMFFSRMVSGCLPSPSMRGSGPSP